MWISKKRFRSLEKKIADLEERVQSQPVTIECLCRKVRPELLVKQVFHGVQKDSDSSAFRVNLNSRKLFEQTSEQK